MTQFSQTIFWSRQLKKFSDLGEIVRCYINIHNSSIWLAIASKEVRSIRQQVVLLENDLLLCLRRPRASPTNFF